MSYRTYSCGCRVEIDPLGAFPSLDRGDELVDFPCPPHRGDVNWERVEALSLATGIPSDLIAEGMREGLI